MKRKYLTRKKIRRLIENHPDILPDFDEANLLWDGYALKCDKRICGTHWIADMETHRIDDTKNRWITIPPNPMGYIPYLKEAYFLPFKERVFEKIVKMDVFPSFLNFFPLCEKGQIKGISGYFNFLVRIKSDMPIAIVKFCDDLQV